MALIKTDWTANDYYNFNDLNLIEETNLATAEKAEIFYGITLALTFVTNRDQTHIEFADSLNRIESNIFKIAEALGFPSGFQPARTDWTFNSPFSFTDANRIGKNTKILYDYISQNIAVVPYAGMYTAGEEGVI